MSHKSFVFPAQILPNPFWVSLANTQCNPIHRYGLSIVIARVRSSSLPKLQPGGTEVPFLKSKMTVNSRDDLKHPKDVEREREIFIYMYIYTYIYIYIRVQKKTQSYVGVCFPILSKHAQRPTIAYHCVNEITKSSRAHKCFTHVLYMYLRKPHDELRFLALNSSTKRFPTNDCTAPTKS